MSIWFHFNPLSCSFQWGWFLSMHYYRYTYDENHWPLSTPRKRSYMIHFMRMGLGRNWMLVQRGCVLACDKWLTINVFLLLSNNDNWEQHATFNWWIFQTFTFQGYYPMGMLKIDYIGLNFGFWSTGKYVRGAVLVVKLYWSFTGFHKTKMVTSLLVSNELSSTSNEQFKEIIILRNETLNVMRFYQLPQISDF